MFSIWSPQIDLRPDVAACSEFQCPVETCKSTFKQNKNVLRHLRTNGDKCHRLEYETQILITCRICKRPFIRPEYRKRHEKLAHSKVMGDAWRTQAPIPSSNLNSFDKAQERLICYHVQHLAPKRTLLKAHDLYLEVAKLSSAHIYLRAALFSLSASYLPHEFKPLDWLHWRAIAIKGLRLANPIATADEMLPILGTYVLLLQFAVEDVELHGEWCRLVNLLPPLLSWAIPFRQTLPYRMRLAAHSILSNTASLPDHQLISVPFLSPEEEGIHEIDGSICISPSLANKIRLATQIKLEQEAKEMVQSLHELRQVCSDPDVDHEVRRVVTTTAETYRLATILLVDWKVPGTLLPPEKGIILGDLEHGVKSLPLFGNLRTALHPLFSVFWLCVTTRHFAKLDQSLLHKMDHDYASNVCPALKQIRKIRKQGDVWQWEELAQICKNTSLT